MGETTWHRVSGRTVRVLALSGVLAVAGAAAATMPRPPVLSELPLLSWWWLALLFAVAEASDVQVILRRETVSISLAEIPLVMGLFLALPPDLVLGRAGGSAAVFLLLRRQTPLKVTFNTALVTGASGAALTVFDELIGRTGQPLEGRSWLAVVVAAGTAGVLEALCLTRVVRWYGDPVPPRTVLHEVSTSIVVSGLVAVVGTVAVLATHAGDSWLPLAITGGVVLLGYRAYAGLVQRYARLERLHRLSGRLATATTTASVTQRVVEETTELLRARHAELILAQERGRGWQRWSVRAGSPVSGPDPYTDPLPLPTASPLDVTTRSGRGLLRRRQPRDALVVRLRVGEETPGFLLVADRSGEEPGFRPDDLRLLQTVADQSSVALRSARLVDRLHYEARHDELTGLPNRLTFREALETAAADAAAGRAPAVVMLLDVNGFKGVNDTLGHHAGDELLQELARRLTAAARDEALVARLGGDEFAVLWVAGAAPAGPVPEVVRARALALAERLLAGFDEPVALAGSRVRLGGSLGVALAPEHADTASDLLRNADIAMYAVKAAGGGTRLFSPDLVTEDAGAVTLAGDLRDAIAAGAITIEVQPVVELVCGAVRSVEVLARWRHPDLGDVPPEVFFAAAEHSGQTAELSALVLDRALGACRDWQRQGRAVRVAVNVAPRALTDGALPERVGRVLARHGLPAGLLCLEITEAGVIAEPAQTLHTLARLRELGVRLSVDDFGTGYSSLTYLSRLPVHQLKIDHSFVARLGASSNDRAVVRSILDLGRNLGLDVVAEGVADAATRTALLDLGCRLGQGYLFGLPMPPDLLPGYLDNPAWPPRRPGVPRGPADVGGPVRPAGGVASPP